MSRSIVGHNSHFLGALICILSYLISINHARSVAVLPSQGGSESRRTIDVSSRIREINSNQNCDISNSPSGLQVRAIEQSSDSNVSPYDYLDRWNIVYNNLAVILPSESSLNLTTAFFENVLAITKASYAGASNFISFTAGSLQMTLSCASQAIPRQVVEIITSSMSTWTRLGLPGFGTIVFYAVKEIVDFIVMVDLFRIGLGALVAQPPHVLMYNVITGRKRDTGDLDGTHQSLRRQ